MEPTSKVRPEPPAPEHPASFASSTIVLVTLNSPREKFWGAVLEITAAGLSLRGIDLNSFDDFAGLVKAGEPASAHLVFFPMHRVERMELDERNGDIPSLEERFRAKTGQAIRDLLAAAENGRER